MSDASRSAVTSRVAETLKLPIYVDSVRLRGVTGSAIASAIKPDTLEVGELLVARLLWLQAERVVVAYSPFR